MSLRFALTPGEPAGIGPDLCLLLTRSAQPHPLIAIASRTLLQERAGQLGLAIDLKDVSPGRLARATGQGWQLYMWDTPWPPRSGPGNWTEPTPPTSWKP
ncbi:hypothetical protein ACPA9J_35580 [Pseudomonas aeruginosa]